MWNMKPRPDGDCFYECLHAETRGILKMPEMIRTKEEFEKWRGIHAKNESLDSESFLEKVEALFGKRLKIQLDRPNVASKAVRVKSNLDVIARMKMEDGVFSSAKYKINLQEGNSMHGINSVRFWLNSLSIHFNRHSFDKSSVIHIVGTHLDQCNGTPEFRKSLILDVLKELKIDVPVFIHEVSLYPIPEVEELMPGLNKFRTELYESIRRLPHMGEKVPRSYGYMMDALQSMSAEREKHRKCLDLPNIFHDD